MISFWVTRAGSFGIDIYRENRGRLLGDRFQTLLYDRLSSVVPLGGGTQIFAALDQLSAAQLRAVAAIWDAHLAAFPSALRLNDPRRVLLRFDLLNRFHAEGVNSYQVWRGHEFREVNRFPAFVRVATDHNGPKTGLLQNGQEVTEAVRALRVRGLRLEDLMIVEYCNASAPDGLFRKYAAFRIGDRIIPCHAMASSHWCVKSNVNQLDAARLREENDYIDANPHEEWLRRVFAEAGADYGRVDYGVSDGVPQVWEINLNPTLGRGSGGRRHASLSAELRELRERGRENFHSRLRAAFAAIDLPGAERTASVSLDDALVARLRTETGGRQRREQLLEWLRDIHGHPRWGWPVRMVYSKLFPPR